jgi:opacity protein-like surface antigen
LVRKGHATYWYLDITSGFIPSRATEGLHTQRTWELIAGGDDEWAAGAGAEWMFASRWSAKAEYLHYDLGTARFLDQPFSGALAANIYQSLVSTPHFSGDIARAGVDYHLAW